MLRIVHLAILPGMLLTTCTAWVFAEPTTRLGNKAAVENKQMYSNRPVGYSVPVPYYGTPMAPRFFVPPAAQYRLAVAAPAPALAPSVVDVPIQVPTASQVSETVFLLREPQPEVSVNDELDVFYARLAKIRLEQRQLPEALALVQKIKSETFKVRTVVSLAEYVSRDKTFQSEAEQLYRLALAGMEALDRGQPFRIDAGGVKAEPQQPVNVQPQQVEPQQPVNVQPQQVEPQQPVNVQPQQVVTPSSTGAGSRPPLFETPSQGSEQPSVAPNIGTGVRPSEFGNPQMPTQTTEQTPVKPDPPDPPPPDKTGDPPNNDIKLPDGAGNGRQQAPPPPDGKNVDGENIVGSPPGQQTTISPNNDPPPARTQTQEEGNGLVPPSYTEPTQRVEPEAHSLDDDPSETTKQETPVVTPNQGTTVQPPRGPRPPTRTITLDEN